MDSPGLKRLIRLEQLLVRKQLSAPDREYKSTEVAERLFCFERFQKAGFLHLYLSNLEEVDTTSVIETAHRLKKRVAVPVINTKERTLSFSELYRVEANDLEIGPFGIYQPKPAFQKKMDMGEIDFWIVPGIAFDERGNRLGYGGGYYDRILCQTRKPIVGLAFELQIVEDVPVESTDVPVDVIFTEKRTIVCREDEIERNTH